MKRILSVALIAIFVLGMAAYASAEVTLGGDYRVRGIMKSDWDFNGSADTAGSDWNYWDQRLRLKADGKVGDVTVNTRITVSEGTWGNSANTNASVTTTSGNVMDPNGATTTALKSATLSNGRSQSTWGTLFVDDDDYAYAVVPIWKGKLTIGRQLADWGNGFNTWQVGTDRAKYVATFGDYTVGILTDKVTETNDGLNDNDYDDYAILGIAKFGDLKAGAILIQYYNNVPADDLTGTVFDIYADGPVGPIKLKAEFAVKTGDNFETKGYSYERLKVGDASIVDTKGDGNSQMGGFVLGTYSMDAITASAALMFASHGYTASKWFNPTVMIGQSQPTAITNFSASDSGNSIGFFIAGDYKISDKMNAGAKLAYLAETEKKTGSKSVCTYNSNSGGCTKDANGNSVTKSVDIRDDVKSIEFDITFGYKLAENTMYNIDFGYMTNDMDIYSNNGATTTAADPAMVLAHKIEVKF